MYMVVLMGETMTMNNTDSKTERPELLVKLRKQIYVMESMNIHKKNPQKDDEMVKKIMTEIKKAVDMEEVN